MDDLLTGVSGRSSADRLLARGLVPAGFALLVAALASLALGAGDVGPGRALAVLIGTGDEDARFAVLELRVPRTLVAVAVGVALGVAGAVLQAAARNPLAEPGLLGVSAGASFAVVVVIAAGASASAVGPEVAVLGAALGCLLAVGAARLRGTGDDPIRLVLAGAALSGLLHAATSVVLLLDQRTADEVRFWTVGSVAGRDLGTLARVGPVLAAGLLLALLVARPLSALALGDATARGLGHRPARARAGAVGAVALLEGERSRRPARSPSWDWWSPSWPARWSAPTCGGCSPSRYCSARRWCWWPTSPPGCWSAPTRCRWAWSPR
jgi:iron complex transport system permease protein